MNLDIHNKKDANLKNLRITALCSLAFARFFRCDELCNIVRRHIEFHSDYIRIFVPRSNGEMFMGKGIFSFSSYTLRSEKTSYTTCRDILRDTLSQLGYNPNVYGLHIVYDLVVLQLRYAI